MLLVGSHVPNESNYLFCLKVEPSDYENCDGRVENTVWVKLDELVFEPAVLTTVGEFGSAPEGTIIDAGGCIALKACAAYSNETYMWYFIGGMPYGQNSQYMADWAKEREFQCRVVRWGWGE